jgi:hypothetical protein
MQYRRSVQGRMLLTELETSARTENKIMTNHNNPQLSRMGLPVPCATFPGLSRLNPRSVNEIPFILLTSHIDVSNHTYVTYREK